VQQEEVKKTTPESQEQEKPVEDQKEL